jgi:glycerol-3-phosphate dehydrogenase
MKRDLDALAARPFDMLVIGAGIAGAAAAWDAAQRGLSVALVDAGDFGAATSWNSLKTIHGGLRHLQRLDIPGLRESVRERRALLRMAPSLVSPLGFVVPARGHLSHGPLAFAAAAFLYNLLSRDRNDGVPEERRLEGARVLSAQQAAELVPGLDVKQVTGALAWQDAQVVRPERLLLSLVSAAAGRGAACANYVEAVRAERKPDGVAAVELRDTRTGRTWMAQARLVLAAAGVGLDPLLERFGLVPTRRPWLSAWNVVLRTTPPRVAAGGAARGRNLFLVPWRGRTMLGTDYAPVSAPPEERVSALLDDAALAFPGVPFRREDVTLVHRGFVPGRDAGALQSRDDLTSHAPWLISATAAKYTTARALAERAVDVALGRLARKPVASRTAETPLVVAPEGASLEDLTRRAVHDEMALHLADVVLRRTDLGTAAAPAEADLARVIPVMARELDWDAAAIEAERRALSARYALQ